MYNFLLLLLLFTDSNAFNIYSWCVRWAGPGTFLSLHNDTNNNNKKKYREKHGHMAIISTVYLSVCINRFSAIFLENIYFICICFCDINILWVNKRIDNEHNAREKEGEGLVEWESSISEILSHIITHIYIMCLPQTLPNG